MKAWIVYLLRCADSSLYCGVITDMQKRLETHNAGHGARYTRSRLPVELVACKGSLSKKKAYRIEDEIKRLPAYRKIEGIGSLAAADDDEAGAYSMPIYRDRSNLGFITVGLCAEGIDFIVWTIYCPAITNGLKSCSGRRYDNSIKQNNRKQHDSDQGRNRY